MDNAKLDTPIGTEEAVKLEPKPVKVTSIEVEQHKFGDREADQLVVMVKHPDKQEPFQIYNVSYQKGKIIKTVGFTIYYDSTGKILKGTAIAELLRTMNCDTIRKLIGKEIQTVMSEKNYLALKAY